MATWVRVKVRVRVRFRGPNITTCGYIHDGPQAEDDARREPHETHDHNGQDLERGVLGDE